MKVQSSQSSKTCALVPTPENTEEQPWCARGEVKGGGTYFGPVSVDSEKTRSPPLKFDPKQIFTVKLESSI